MFISGNKLSLALLIILFLFGLWIFQESFYGRRLRFTKSSLHRTLTFFNWISRPATREEIKQKRMYENNPIIKPPNVADVPIISTSSSSSSQNNNMHPPTLSTASTTERNS